MKGEGLVRRSDRYSAKGGRGNAIRQRCEGTT